MSGIFGWGFIRKRAVWSALNPGRLAIEAKVGTLSVPRGWSGATIWHEAHQRLANVSPCAASAASAAPGRSADSMSVSAAAKARVLWTGRRQADRVMD